MKLWGLPWEALPFAFLEFLHAFQDSQGAATQTADLHLSRHCFRTRISSNLPHAQGYKNLLGIKT